MSARIGVDILAAGTLAVAASVGFNLSQGKKVAGRDVRAPISLDSPGQASPRVVFTYRTQPVPAPPPLTRPATDAGKGREHRRREQVTIRTRSRLLPDGEAICDDFEGRRLRSCWRRTRAEGARCGPMTEPGSDNRVLRMKTRDRPGSHCVKVSTGSDQWKDYEVRFRFRLVQGVNAYFEFRALPGRDAIIVQTNGDGVIAGSSADGLLGSVSVRNRPLPESAEEKDAGRAVTGAPSGPSLDPETWYWVVARLRQGRFDFRLIPDGDKREQSDLSDDALLISARTRLRRGGIAVGVCRGEMWVDDLKVRHL